MANFTLYVYLDGKSNPPEKMWINFHNFLPSF